MLMDVLMTIAGIVVLLIGGEAMVKGAASLARSLGISPLAVGLTVVAFGTSAPELAVSVGAALSGSGTLAFGNIFGSNMANIGLIVGLSAIVQPLPIDNLVIRRELPMMLLAVAAASVMALDSDLGAMRDIYTRSDGLALLLFFVVFLYYTVGDLVSRRSNGEQAAPVAAEPVERHIMRDLGLAALGLVGLFFGAELTVEGGVGVARGLGVSEVIVGLTLVSVGTSLPELAAAITAVRRKEVDIAIGGVVGSNIFNTLLVLGLTSVVRPIEIPARGQLDIAATAVLSLALLFVARTHAQRIIRYEGVGLLALYLLYVIWRTLSQPV